MARDDQRLRIKPLGWLVVLALLAAGTAYYLHPKAQPQYVASSETRIYHRLNCRYVSQIKPEHLQYFELPSEAEKAGHRPCQVCRP